MYLISSGSNAPYIYYSIHSTPLYNHKHCEIGDGGFRGGTPNTSFGRILFFGWLENVFGSNLDGRSRCHIRIRNALEYTVRATNMLNMPDAVVMPWNAPKINTPSVKVMHKRTKSTAKMYMFSFIMIIALWCIFCCCCCCWNARHTRVLWWKCDAECSRPKKSIVYECVAV